MCLVLRDAEINEPQANLEGLMGIQAQKERLDREVRGSHKWHAVERSVGQL